MRLITFFLAVAFAACMAVPVAATSVESTVVTANGLTTYNYALASDETNDLITSFHVYTPTTRSVIVDMAALPGWTSTIDPDPEGGLDVFWTADGDGLASGASLTFSLSTPAYLPMAVDYVIPGFLGNWGYETLNWSGWGVLVMPTSLPVPAAPATAVPEPLGMIALGAWCIMMAPWRRAK